MERELPPTIDELSWLIGLTLSGVPKTALVAGACLAAGFAGGLLAAPGIRGSRLDAPAQAAPVSVEPARGPEQARVRDKDQLRRLAVAATSLERAAQAGPAPSAGPQPVTLQQLPAPVRSVLSQITQGRQLRGLTLERLTREGRPVFETDFRLDGVAHELKLDEQGRVLESEVEFAVGELPAAITSGIQAALPGAVFLDAEREQNGDAPAYFEVNLRHDGQLAQVKVSEDGRVLQHRPR